MNIETLVGLTIGFTGADIKNMVNLAGYECLRNNKNLID